MRRIEFDGRSSRWKALKAAFCIFIIIILGIRGLATGEGTEHLTEIFVYASWEYPARSWVPVSCDGTLVAKVKRGRFFAINVGPGKHMLTQNDGIPLVVNAHSGQQMFVHLGQEVSDEPSGKVVLPVLQAVAPENGRKEIVHLVYVDSDKLYSSAVSRQDPTQPSPPRLKQRGDPND
jgi:hypothetical protein